MIIDFRLRPPFGDFLNCIMYNTERSAKVASNMGMVQPPSVANKSMELMFGEMERAGITKGVVPGRKANPKMGNVSNSDIEELLNKYPDKFVGFAGIDPTNWEEALEEIEKTVISGPFKGIVLEPGVLTVPMYANDRRMYPVYNKCAKLGVPVILMTGGNAGPDISYTMPVAVDQVAADFPALKLIISHGGWPWVTEILHVAFRRPNIYISPDMYLVNMPGVQDYVTAANYFLQDRFLFATSYPFIPLEEGVIYFKQLSFKIEVIDKLLYKNAAKLLELE